MHVAFTTVQWSAVMLCIMVKGKGAEPQWGLGEVLISQTLAVEPVGGWTTESATHDQCDARGTVTFPAAERHRPLPGTKLYCLVTQAQACEQLAQSCYLVADWPGVELATFRSRANALTTELPTRLATSFCTHGNSTRNSAVPIHQPDALCAPRNKHVIVRVFSTS